MRLPAPADALLVGLILQRLWCDGGYLKPHDVIDTRFRFELTTRASLDGSITQPYLGRAG